MKTVIAKTYIKRSSHNVGATVLMLGSNEFQVQLEGAYHHIPLEGQEVLKAVAIALAKSRPECMWEYLEKKVALPYNC